MSCSVLHSRTCKLKEKVKITGKVIEKISKQPLEYATITLINHKKSKRIAGGITNTKGEFDVACCQVFMI